MQSRDPNSHFTSVVGLGPLKAEHPYKGAGRWVGLVFGFLCMLAVPASVLLAIYLWFVTYDRRGLLPAEQIIVGPLAIAGIALVVGGLVLFNVWRNWPLAAALYDSGFAYNDRKGLRQVRWDQVEAVWQSVTKHYTNGVYTGTTHVYTVRAGDGVRIVLDDKLAKVEDLGQAILKNSAIALFPRYWQTLQSGQRVTFVPFALDRDGLYSGSKALQWNEIKGIKIQRGVISVKKEGGWFNWASATVPQIPNFYIFYELVGRFTKVE